MQNQDNPHITEAQPERWHALTAVNIVAGTAERVEMVRLALEGERRRKPRRKSIGALVKIARRAGLAVTEIFTDHISTSAAEGEQANGHADSKGEANPWHTV